MIVIGVTRCRKLNDYEEAIRLAGGEPLVIDADTHAPDEAVRSVAGLLLTGGGDVEPGLYGAAAHRTCSAAEPGRDEFEIHLVRRALENDLPLLAICRGIQVLNVACGGTLVQDIPSQLRRALQHRLTVPPHESSAPAHEIQVERGTLLRTVAAPHLDDRGCCVVNSRHHQAVEVLGRDLAIVATAPDGVIEAIENPARHFCLGVQWHPENFHRTGEFRGLFEGLVSAAGR